MGPPWLAYPLLVHGRLGGFYCLAVANDAAVNVGEQTSVQGPAFNSFECIPRSGVAGNGNSVFNFLRIHLTISRGGGPILQNKAFRLNGLCGVFVL